MRILISGSRNWLDYRGIQRVIVECLSRAEAAGETLYVRHGKAKGADKLAGLIAYGLKNSGHAVEVEEFPADWQHPGCTHPKGMRNGEWYCMIAGPVRNQAMLDAEGTIDEAHTFPLQAHRGTGDMMERAVKAGIPVYNHGWPTPEIEGVIDVKKNIG